MKKNNNVRPTGLKGNEQVNRMRSLMGMTPINEGTSKRSVLELSKLGPDGRVYGIVRENQDYFIKISNNKPNLVVEDFSYIGGLKNKTSVVFESYAKAIKQLNLKFISLNEALDKRGEINTFKNDADVLSESFESYPEKPKASQPDKPLGTVKDEGKNDGHDEEIIGDEGEDGNPDVDTPKTVNDADVTPKGDDGDPFVEDAEVELTEAEKAIDKMILEGISDEVVTESKEPIVERRLSIAVALNNITEGIQSQKKK